MSRRLDPQAYAALRSEVLQRDGWRCQWCGSLNGVEVHHLIHRSQGGADLPENLLPVLIGIFGPALGALSARNLLRNWLRGWF
jgi:5-methylcytosine-specific restriction endonuclease McrA